MQNTRFSFGTIFPTNQLSTLPTTISQPKHSQSQQSYKQKYLQCKQNIKHFMLMVQKQFQELTKKHHAEKQSLMLEIARLKSQSNEKNDVSSFTVRSKRANDTNEKSQRNRSMSQEHHQLTNPLSFEGVSAFDQSKIHSRTKSIVDKNLSSISTPNTLLDLENALNQRNTSRISSRTVSTLNEHLSNNTHNNSTSNVTQYTNQVLGKKNKNFLESQKKQNFDALMQKMIEKNINKMIEKNINSQGQKEKSRVIEKSDCFSGQQLRQTPHNSQNKQNVSCQTSNRNDQKSKTQQTSVRNLLKNLRSSMKNNIEKESHLEATTLSAINN